MFTNRYPHTLRYIIKLSFLALFGILFKDDQEPAFSNLRLWQSVGFMISFAYSNFLCIWIKIIILWCILGVSMAGYLIVEMTVRRRRIDGGLGNPPSEKESKNEWNGMQMLELESNFSCDQQSHEKCSNEPCIVPFGWIVKAYRRRPLGAGSSRGAPAPWKIFRRCAAQQRIFDEPQKRQSF